MPPRKKSAQAAAVKAQATQAAASPQEKSALAKDVVHLEAKWAADLQDLRLSVAGYKNVQEIVAVETAKRLAALEQGVVEAKERTRTHEIAGATRRAATASRIATLESHAAETSRLRSEASDTGLVHEDQLSQALRNLWLVIAGVGTAVAVVAIKTFAS